MNFVIFQTFLHVGSRPDWITGSIRFLVLACESENIHRSDKNKRSIPFCTLWIRSTRRTHFGSHLESLAVLCFNYRAANRIHKWAMNLSANVRTVNWFPNNRPSHPIRFKASETLSFQTRFDIRPKPLYQQMFSHMTAVFLKFILIIFFLIPLKVEIKPISKKSWATKK